MGFHRKKVWEEDLLQRIEVDPIFLVVLEGLCGITWLAVGAWPVLQVQRIYITNIANVSHTSATSHTPQNRMFLLREKESMCARKGPDESSEIEFTIGD